ncbi:MAG: gamma-glutamyl-gamma-aminobutyrate hydrolase family protein [Trebonia sp.]
MRVLFVKHDHASPSGLVGDAFTSLRWDVSELTVVPEARFHSPDVPVVFPSAAAFDALVFYGAPWSVYDTQAIGTWIGDEIAFARSAISLGVPVLGICFGGQMLATALGGSVALAPVPEIGWISVSTSAPGLIAAGPWFSWHYDQFTLPSGVDTLARTALANQAFSVGRSLGLQFHPEVDEEVLKAWLASGGEAQLAEAGIAIPPLLARTRELTEAASARAEVLVRRFVTDVARRPAVPVPVLPLAADATVLTHPRWQLGPLAGLACLCAA